MESTLLYHERHWTCCHAVSILLTIIYSQIIVYSLVNNKLFRSIDSFAYIDELVSRLDAMLKDENENRHIYQAMTVSRVDYTVLDYTRLYCNYTWQRGRLSVVDT